MGLEERFIKLTDSGAKLLFADDDSFFYLRVIALVAQRMKDRFKKGEHAVYVPINEFEEQAWSLSAEKPRSFKSKESMRTNIYQTWRYRLKPKSEKVIYEVKWPEGTSLADRNWDPLERLFKCEPGRGPAKAAYRVEIEQKPNSIEIIPEAAGASTLAPGGVDLADSKHLEKELGYLRTTPFMPLDKRLAPKLGRYPTKHDFDSGVYYRDDKLHNEVVRILETNRRCLIVGTPGCGKTTLALAIAYEFSTDGQNTTYYCDLSQESITETSTEIIRAYGGNVLVLLDNVHCKSEDVNSLLFNIGKHKCKVLLVVRKVGLGVTLSAHPDGTHSSISYLDILGGENAIKSLAVTQVVLLNVIDRFSQREKIEKKKLGDAAVLLKKCRGDLHILRFYFDAWKRKGYPGYLSDMDEETILDYVYYYYLKEKPYEEQLLKVSALSQLEILADSKWIEKGLETLQVEGLLEPDLTDEVQDGMYITWLRVYHSTPARYFLLAAAHDAAHPMRSVKQFTLMCLRDYLSTSPHNFFEVFRQLYTHGQQELYSRLLGSPSTVHAAKRIVRKAAPRYIKSNIGLMLIFAVRLMDLKSNTSFAHAEEIVKLLLPRLSALDAQKIGISTFSRVFHVAWKLHLDPGPFAATLDFRALGERAQEENKGLASIQNFISKAQQSGVPAEKIIRFCDSLNFRTLAEQAKEKNTGFATIQSFIVKTPRSGVPAEKIIRFCDSLDFCRLGEQARDNNIGLATIASFIITVRQLGISAKKIRSFCNMLNFYALGEQAMDKKVGLATIATFLQRVRQIGVKRSLWAIFFEPLVPHII